MKKWMIVIISLLLCIIPVHADSGPKPSISIDIKGLSQQKYYVTLLSQEKSSGPFSVYDEGDEIPYEDGTEESTVWEKMIQYQDSDHFYFLQYFDNCTDTDYFVWNYYPPENFKILIYFPDTEQFLVSSIYSRYAFDSYYVVTVSSSTIQVSVEYSVYFQSFLERILLTLIIELVVAFLFGIRQKKQIFVIICINMITQILLNFCLMIFKGTSFFFLPFVYIPLEVIVIIIENKVYQKYLEIDEKKKIKAYTIIANILSFLLGLLII